MNILIYEKSPIVLRSLERLLPGSITGKLVFRENDFEAILSDNIQIIILDYDLLGSSIYKIIGKLKEVSHVALIIVLSNLVHVDLKKKCREAGADYFLDKSFEFEKIYRIIEEMNEIKTKNF